MLGNFGIMAYLKKQEIIVAMAEYTVTADSTNGKYGTAMGGYLCEYFSYDYNSNKYYKQISLDLGSIINMSKSVNGKLYVRVGATDYMNYGTEICDVFISTSEDGSTWTERMTVPVTTRTIVEQYINLPTALFRYVRAYSAWITSPFKAEVQYYT